MEREKFGTRLGFILVSAGCAIGLGNVWRFPYITGEYGGAAFVIMYLVFLAIFALPALIMEFAAGRASQRSIARSYDVLEPAGTKWHAFKWLALAGNYLLMMFYTTVGGWMLAFVVKSASGEFVGLESSQVADVFNGLLADPVQLAVYMLIIVGVGVGVTRAGVQKGVERVTKVMMMALFVVLVALCVRAVTLPGAAEGLRFYLMPDFSKMFAGATLAEQLATFGDAVYAAMGQAFFTVSVGMGGMSIFGSYIGKDRRLLGESITIVCLDTFVAIMSGLIIFPACFAYGVSPDQGPSLVFVTLPVVFGQMPLGNVWGCLFFVFMAFASLSTVIAVFENLISWSMDKWGMMRSRAVIFNAVLVLVLSIPCALGFNVLSGVTIPAIGDIQSIEDFIVSNNMLPLGSLVLALFCCNRFGWGWDNFVAEANTGKGLKVRPWMKPIFCYFVPAAILFIYLYGMFTFTWR